MMKRIFLFLVLGLLVWGPRPIGAQSTGHPVVVELFTSQGCHSCPPADALLGELAERPNVIALAFHVDYWDYIGWKDPFASPDYTLRQRRYARAMRLRTIYTPQMVIDGQIDVVGSRRGQVERTIARQAVANAADRISIPVKLTRERGGGLLIEVAAGHAPRPAEILLVSYDKRHVTPVPRGENAGRTLVDFNVVRGLWRVGEWSGRAVSIRVTKSDLPILGRRTVALLQALDHGPILGAARAYRR